MFEWFIERFRKTDVQTEFLREKRKAIKIMHKVMKKHNDIEIAIKTLRKQNVTPMVVVRAITEVLNITIDQADSILLKSRAFSDMKDNTLKMRKCFFKELEKDVDKVCDLPDGRRRLTFDLTKYDEEL